LIPALNSGFLLVFALPVAKQPTDDSMLLSGTQGKQRTTTTLVGEQDSPLTSKHLETTLLSDTFVERSQGGAVYTS